MQQLERNRVQLECKRHARAFNYPQVLLPKRNPKWMSLSFDMPRHITQYDAAGAKLVGHSTNRASINIFQGETISRSIRPLGDLLALTPSRSPANP